jgi:Holliday junction resolvase-like predicted endonuclease
MRTNKAILKVLSNVSLESIKEAENECANEILTKTQNADKAFKELQKEGFKIFRIRFDKKVGDFYEIARNADEAVAMVGIEKRLLKIMAKGIKDIKSPEVAHMDDPYELVDKCKEANMDKSNNLFEIFRRILNKDDIICRFGDGLFNEVDKYKEFAKYTNTIDNIISSAYDKNEKFKKLDELIGSKVFRNSSNILEGKNIFQIKSIIDKIEK